MKAGRKLKIPWHEQDTRESLFALYRAERDGRKKERLHALWLMRSGWTAKRVSAALGVHYTTVQRWVKWYRTGGLDKMVSRRRGGYGRQSYLDKDDLTLLEWEIEAGVFGTAKELRDYIEKQCGVSYTMPGVYSLMKRLNDLSTNTEI